jgi:hypothetical protein
MAIGSGLSPAAALKQLKLDNPITDGGREMPASDEQAPAWRASYGKVVAKAWVDAAYKAKLLADPASVLAEAGVEVPAGVTVKVVEDTSDTVHLILPPAPPEDELTDEALDKVAAGVSMNRTGGTRLTF